MVEDKIEIKENLMDGKYMFKILSFLDILYKSAISKIFLSIFFIEPKMASYKTGNIIINTTI